MELLGELENPLFLSEIPQSQIFGVAETLLSQV